MSIVHSITSILFFTKSFELSESTLELDISMKAAKIILFVAMSIPASADEIIPSASVGRDLISPNAAPTQQRAAAVQAAVVNGITVQFGYDSLGRLVQEAYPTNTGSYAYDAAGNRTAATAQ